MGCLADREVTVSFQDSLDPRGRRFQGFWALGFGLWALGSGVWSWESGSAFLFFCLPASLYPFFFPSFFPSMLPFSLFFLLHVLQLVERCSSVLQLLSSIFLYSLFTELSHPLRICIFQLGNLTKPFQFIFCKAYSAHLLFVLSVRTQPSKLRPTSSSSSNSCWVDR